MMFLLLLYGDEAADAELPVTEQRRIIEEHERFADRLDDDGVLVFTAALDQSDEARTVRDDDVADGPFVAGPHQLGSVYVVKCGDVEQATEYARQAPRSPGLAVEVRPLLDF